jgi:RNA polymerase sigma factor (sigma-70 family)
MAKPYFGGTLEVELENEPDLDIPWSDIARLREDMDELSDDSLIGLVKGGSADAYAVLFERYRHPAHRLAAYYSNSVDAKDIVAESFTQVYQQLRRGQGPETSFRGYLLTAVRREAGRRAKMRKRDTPTDDIATIDRSVPFGNGAVDGFERDLIQKAFATLPQRWQKVLWHLDVDGRKPREVAPMLDMKPNSVSALAYRAREGLRKAYLEQHILAKGESLSATCQEVRHRLVAFVRATANKSESTKVESHLQTCSRCTSAYHELEELNSHIGAVSGVLVLSFAAPVVAGPLGGAAGGVVGHLGGLTAKATLLGKTVAAAAGSTAAALITSMTVVDLPLQPPAEAATVHAQPFAAEGQHEPDRTIGPAGDGTLGRSVTSSTWSPMDSTGSGQDQAMGESGQSDPGQTPGSTPSQGSSSGGSLPATVNVDGTKTSVSVDAVGVKVNASVDLKKPLETRVTVKAGNLDIDTDKVTKKVTEKITKKVTEKLVKDRDAD